MIEKKDKQKYTQEQLKLMKTQDIGYMLMKKMIDKNKAEKLKASLHSLEERATNKHTVFVDSQEDNISIQYQKLFIRLITDQK
jgi:U3 small nucleolar RNA-associated protein 11